jgi:hypothetical protein
VHIPPGVEIHDAVEDVKSFGVLAMQMETKRKFALAVIFHQRIGAAGIGRSHLDEGVIAGPVVIRSAARRNESIALLQHAPSRNVPHALDLPAGGTARCLMIFQPAGFDQFLAELAALSEAQMADEKLMGALNDKYDIINLGDVPPRS